MKKKFLLTFILIIWSVLVLGAFSVSAQTDGDYTYTVSNGVATITGCNTLIEGDVL